MKSIKFMPDYQCFPLWGMDAVGNVNPVRWPIYNDDLTNALLLTVKRRSIQQIQSPMKAC